MTPSQNFDWTVFTLHGTPNFTWELDPLKELDRTATMSFLNRWRHLFHGVVLDYGCGAFRKLEDLRYRELILSNGAVYTPWDPNNAAEWCKETAPLIHTGFNLYDAILCTQVLCDSNDPIQCMDEMWRLLIPGGYLILTYPTCWREADVNDKWRFTFSGMEALAKRAGFEIIEHVRRAEFVIVNFHFCIGGGIVLRKKL